MYFLGSMNHDKKIKIYYIQQNDIIVRKDCLFFNDAVRINHCVLNNISDQIMLYIFPLLQYCKDNPAVLLHLIPTFFLNDSAGTNMPIIRNLSKVVKQTLLSTPGCGCQPLTVAVRTISFSPRQVTSDASFHSVSFSGTDHPKVLITGMERLIQAARCSLK